MEFEKQKNDHDRTSSLNASDEIDDSISQRSDANKQITDTEKNTDTAESGVTQQQPTPWTPPDGGYGWVCVITVFLINAHTWGLNSAYGVFLAHYLSTSTFPGATRIQFAFIGGLSISAALLISPIATTTTRIFGTRTTLLLGVTFETTSFIAASFASKIWHLFLSQGVCFGMGMGFLFVGSVGIVPQWFVKKRSLANGISAAGSGLGGLIYSLATQAMISSIGLPWAFRVLGIIAFVVNLICSLLVKDRNNLLGSSQLAFDARLFERIEFVVLLAYGVFSMLGYVVLVFSIPSYATHIGLAPSQASIVGAILNLGQAYGRPPIGYFSDSFGRLNMAGTMTFLSGLLVLVVWVNAKSFGVLIFYGLVGGPVAGTFWATIAPVTAEVVGLKELPAALSISWLALTIPTLFSEPIGLAIVSKEGGSYLGAQLFSGIMYIAAAACVWWLKAWKMGQLERIALTEQESVDTVSPIRVESRPHMDHKGWETSKEVKISPFFVRLFKWQKV